MTVRRNMTIASAAMLLALQGPRRLDAAAETPWAEVASVALRIVQAETPAGALPFRPQKTTDRRRIGVLAHYFPFFQTSFDNAAADHDQWAKFLSRDAEGGKYAAAGGMVRERPLPIAPLPTPAWREASIAVDVLRARTIGLAGFGLDLVGLDGSDAFRQAQLICDVAAHVAPDFKIAIEPDVDILKNASPEDVAHAVEKLAACPSTYRLPDGRLLLVPFAPEEKPLEYWQRLIAALRRSDIQVAFVPDFVDRLKPLDMEILNLAAGVTDWGVRDPSQLPSEQAQIGTFVARLNTPVWMFPVAPQDERPKNAVFHESQNTVLYRRSWEAAIASSAQFVHILTWNDFGEATEVSPSSGAQFVFYDLTAFYALWFMAGHQPEITRDAIFYTMRDQVLDPSHPRHPGDSAFEKLGPTPTSNRIEMIGFLTSPAEMEISLNGHWVRGHYAKGVATIEMAAAPGRPEFRIIRNGKTIVTKIADFPISEAPDKINPTYFGGSSERTYVRVPEGTKQ